MTGTFAEYTISRRLPVRHRTQPRTDGRCRIGERIWSGKVCDDKRTGTNDVRWTPLQLPQVRMT